MTVDLALHLQTLNPEQLEGATTLDGPVLVLAGAGTGKTKLLTARVCELLSCKRTKSWRILVATFTTKAAGEMHDRISATLRGHNPPRWLGTFHALSRKLLAKAPEIAHLKADFQVADTKDTRKLLVAIMKARGMQTKADENGDPVAAISSRIEKFKGFGWTPEEAAMQVDGQWEEAIRQALARQAPESASPGEAGQDRKAAEEEAAALFDRQLVAASEIYPVYQSMLRAENKADFGDLLFWPTLAMEADESLRKAWAGQFDYLLVDEYQDTSVLQLRWLKALAKDHRNIFCVGDDDQSIYGWRQAEVSNILRFTEHFPGAKIVRLVRNYRCSGTILAAANALIANNAERLGKELVATREMGEKITVAECGDDVAEASMIVRTIERMAADGADLSEVAVLYRMSFLSREIEEQLLKVRLPYEVVGQAGFWSREEIRDSVAYLRLLQDLPETMAAAFERVGNKPPRGIGEVSMNRIIELAADKSLSPLDAAMELAEAGEFRADTEAGVRRLCEVVGNARAANLPPASLLMQILEEIGYRQWLRAHEETAEDAEERLGNLDELLHAAMRWQDLDGFLAHVRQVEANAAAGKKGELGSGRVRLMTLHAAKGLEFSDVFSPGWEEGILPSGRSVEEGRLEEERRLAYVDLTRGKRKVTLSWAVTRRGKMVPSRFLEEIPAELVEQVKIDVPPQPPSQKMLDFAIRISADLGIPVPDGWDRDGTICAGFLDQHKPAWLAKHGLGAQAEPAA